jgi:hypothetical protein
MAALSILFFSLGLSFGGPTAVETRAASDSVTAASASSEFVRPTDAAEPTPSRRGTSPARAIRAEPDPQNLDERDGFTPEIATHYRIPGPELPAQEQTFPPGDPLNL